MIMNKRCICEQDGGCVEQGEPCLMFRSKERWTEAGMPIRDEDKDIVTLLVKVKKKFDAKKNYDKKGKFNKESKEKFINELETTTMNLAPRNWRERIQGDKALRAEVRQRKAAVLEDFIGCNSTRCWCCWCGGGGAGAGLVEVEVLVWWCWCGRGGGAGVVVLVLVWWRWWCGVVVVLVQVLGAGGGVQGGG